MLHRIRVVGETSFRLVNKAKKFIGGAFGVQMRNTLFRKYVATAGTLLFFAMVAYSEVQSAKIGDHTFFFSELDDGTLCIENSEAFQFAKDKQTAPTAVMPKPVGTFEIPTSINGKTVSAIGPAALFLSPVQEVILPKTIKSIGAGAFSHCFKLETVRLPESCTQIGDGAFYGCAALKTMQIPLGVTHVGRCTFFMCEGLEEVSIPKSVTNIEDYAFVRCRSLKKVLLPLNLTHLGDGAFAQCTSLVDVKIPMAVENLSVCVFQGCSNLVSVTINREYRSPAGSFRNCPKLDIVYGLDKFNEIDLDDFEGSKLEAGISPNKDGLLLLDGWVFGFVPNKTGKYEITQGLRPINRVFTKLPQPSEVYIDGDCPYFNRVSMWRWEFTNGVPVDCSTGTFEGCTNLVSLIVGKAIKKNCEEGKCYSPYSCIGAFKNCKNLKSVVVEGGYCGMSGKLFEGCESLEHFTLPGMPMTPFKIWASAVPKKFRDKLYKESLENAQVACMYLIDSYANIRYHGGVFDAQRFFLALESVTRFMSTHPDKNATHMKYCMEVFDEVCFWLKAYRLMANKSGFPSAQEAKLYHQMMHRALANVYHDAYACAEMGDAEAEAGNEVTAVGYYKMSARAYAEKEIEDMEKRKNGSTTNGGLDVLVTCRQCMLEQIDKIRKLGFVKTAEQLLAELDAKIDGSRVADKKQHIVTGTGWAVSPSHIVTCWHVVKNAKQISCEFSDGVSIGLSLVAADKANDIAVLKIVGARKLRDVLPVRSRPLKISESVFTIGYPLPSILGQSQKYTEGTVSAVSGIDNDLRFYQISVPIQLGNSGGALVNSNGEVVGITSAGLDAIKTFGVTGSIPQNVNYAIKARYLTALLDDNDIQYETTSLKGATKDKVILHVEKATVLIRAENK